MWIMLTGANALAQTIDWSVTNQVTPYTSTPNVPGVTVPQVTVPRPGAVQIPAATNAPTILPAKSSYGETMPPLTPPSATDIARETLVIKPLALPEAPAPATGTNDFAAPTESLVPTNSPAAKDPWAEIRTPAVSE